MSQGSFNPKIRFLGQKMWPVARAHTAWLLWASFQGFGSFSSTYHKGSSQLTRLYDGLYKRRVRCAVEDGHDGVGRERHDGENVGQGQAEQGQGEGRQFLAGKHRHVDDVWSEAQYRHYCLVGERR